MSKEQLTKNELEEKRKQLQSEIETLQNVIEASNTPVFDLLINEVKKQMEENIAEEDWKTLKQNQKKIEAYRSVERIIQNQTDLLDEKRAELDDVEENLTHYQTNLFELTAKETGYKTADDKEIQTGDVFERVNTDGTSDFTAVMELEGEDGKFTLISTSFKGELGMQYPKNREELEEYRYVGNIYVDEDLQPVGYKQRALYGFNKILETAPDGGENG